MKTKSAKKKVLELKEGTDIFWVQDETGYIIEKGDKEYLEEKYFPKKKEEGK